MTTAHLTAPVPTREPVPFPFTIHVPRLIEDDPELCAAYWATRVRCEGWEPVGPPDVRHVEGVLLRIGGKLQWVSDDGSPVQCVVGDVLPRLRSR